MNKEYMTPVTSVLSLAMEQVLCTSTRLDDMNNNEVYDEEF